MVEDEEAEAEHLIDFCESMNYLELVAEGVIKDNRKPREE